MKDTFNVVLLGEAGVGKSALINKFADPNYTFTPVVDYDYYWSYQANPSEFSKKMSVNGQNITLNFSEVAGSKGRMSNYYEVMNAAKTADCICYCFSGDNEWTLNSLQHTLDIAFRDNTNTTASNRSRKSKKQKTQTTPTQTPQAGSIPVILIQTKSERGTIDAAKNLSKEKTYPLVEVSALEGTNIEQCFKVISEAVISSSSSKKQVQQPQPQVKEETPSIPETKTEIPVSNKVKENNIWSKLMTKFLGKLQDKAEKVETLETENLESTAPVA